MVSATPPASGAVPSNEGRRRRTAAASSSPVNQTKLSKTTGIEDFASSTTKVTTPSPVFELKR